MLKKFLLLFLLMPTLSLAKPASVSSLKPSDLKNFSQNSPAVQKLIKEALGLTRKNLTYRYGGRHPKEGGMDCSGTIQYVLKHNGLSAPRQADQQYVWAKKSRQFTPARGIYSFEDKKFSKLKPGDLLFWKGTYNINRLASHSMIYLGIEKKTGRPVMFGSSDGRRHNGKRITGVSVFDFKLPQKGKKAKFLGYGPIPSLALNSVKSKKKSCKFFKFLCKKAKAN